MGNKVNTQRQILPNQEAKPIGGGDPNRPNQSRQTLTGGIGNGANLNTRTQNTKPQTARSNGGKGLNMQSQNIQPQTARSNGGKGLNMQSNTTKGAVPLTVNNNVNQQQNDFPAKSIGVGESGFDY